MFGKLAEAQKHAEEIKARLNTITVSGEAGNGMVKVTCTANKQLTEVSIDESLLTTEQKQQIEHLVLTAANAALQQAEQVSGSEMQALMNQLLPGGLANLFGKK